MDIHALAEQLALNPMDPKALLQTFGLPGVLVILFAETGLLAGFFFPGDSLLFLAGVGASPVADSIFGDGARMSITGLLIGAPICAIIGAQFGHWLGAKYGRRMFDKPDSKLFKKEYVEKAEYYFEKFGPAKAVVLARFIPIVRTFLNPVAGTLGMPARQFFIWNVVGAILWTDGILLIGYLLAQQIYDAIGDQIDHYILPVVALIILISVLPILIEILRERRLKKQGLAKGADPADTVGPATAVGVVAAATVAGLADAAHEEYEQHHYHGHHEAGHPQHGGHPQQGHPQQGYSQQGVYPQATGHPSQGGYPQQDGYPQQGEQFGNPPQQYPPQQYGHQQPGPGEQGWPRG